jgi:hypothetical protein
MYTNNTLFFPAHAISSLRNLRGERWQALVEHVLTLPEKHEATIAFMWMMVRLNGCAGCETDSFRAMRGCIACAQQTLRRYKGSDDELLAAYDRALAEVRRFAQTDARFEMIMGEPVEECLRAG